MRGDQQNHTRRPCRPVTVTCFLKTRLKDLIRSDTNVEKAIMDTFDRTWQGSEPLLFITWNRSYTHERFISASLRFFRCYMVYLWREVTLELKSRIPLCFPYQFRIPTLRKHKFPFPLATEIPASRPCFQLKSRISPREKPKSCIPPNLLGTLRNISWWRLRRQMSIIFQRFA